MADISNKINFEIRNCDSFAFEDTSTYVASLKTLTITFPDSNQLIFTEASDTFPTFGSNQGYLGLDTHEVLGDLDEWGFDINGKIIYANLDNLKEDIADNPAMFKGSDGSNTSFSYSKFPSGIYKLEYSFTEIPVDTIHSGTHYYLFADTASLCLKNKIQQLFEFDTEDDTTKYQYDKLKDEIMKIIMMIHIAEFDFSNNAYEEANLKLLACDNLCLSGDLGYKFDAAR